MSKTEFKYLLGHAQRCGYKYFAVVVRRNDGVTSVNINSMKDVEEKMRYYDEAYTEDLLLRVNPNIRIITAVYGDTFNDIDSVVKRMMEANR